MRILVIICLSVFLVSCHPQTSVFTIDNENSVGIENDKLAIHFSKNNGQLLKLINKGTNDNYLKNEGKASIFRLFVNTTTMPKLKAGAHDNDYGGVIVEPSNCYLLNSSFEKEQSNGTLRLTYKAKEVPLEIALSIRLDHGKESFDSHLEVRNVSHDDVSVYAAFPYLSGICLGTDANSNLMVNMWDRGYPGEKAWENVTGGVYGQNVMMQWQCVYDPIVKEGLAIVTMDTLFTNKIYSCVPDGGLNVLYFDEQTLTKGKAFSWPENRIMAFNGNWRKAARAYGEWFSTNVETQKVPAWYKKEVVKRASTWLPSQETVSSNKRVKGEELFKSFRQLHDAYRGTYNDCMEIAMWNEGVNLWPETYGPWMSSGFIGFRSDLGGLEDFTRGVEECHKYGRRVGMYVAGYGIRKDSPLLKGEWKKYAIVKNERGVPLMDYRNGDNIYGAFCCPGYKPWQDNIIRVCCMLAKAGVDEIRLDELGFPFKPCFNPEHHHESPYNSNKWMRTMLKRVRQATDSINPDLFISTEFFMDYFSESTNGALVMDCSGHEIDAMKVALPDYLPLSYHASASEAAFKGAIMAKTESLRKDWAWGNIGAEKPDDFTEENNRELLWHELAGTLQDAVIYGEISEWDPVALNNSKWMGHLWKSDSYWVLTGGHVDGEPLREDVLVQLPEVPKGVKKVYEFNLETLQMRETEIDVKNEAGQVQLKFPMSAVLFPFKNCKPLPLIQQRMDGKEIKVEVSLYSPWSDDSRQYELSRITMNAPGFEVEQEIIDDKKLFTIHLGEGVSANEYYYTISGDCMNAKRWFSIRE
ncbi:hypothetical protein KDU71_10015 [Carboxylicivirga sediminis]|uniref:DUF6259 domain-containing protein n=1 Tax=Carboxylicivirga sediminis TaxID=2006564 RepID=A0A941IWL1_9BACT|nr:DUF6259 domain-containing protein [Carboxylicivirga sediminis]MBR8535891.1 hypothetical protein [Carboxylicivirga sediminis]